MQIAEDHRSSISTDIYYLITNMGLKCSAEKYNDILHPICIAVNKMQTFFIWNELCTKLNDVLSVEKQQMVANRHKLNLNLADFLAFYLDPRYFEKKTLDYNEQSVALNYASEINSNLLLVIAQHRAQSAPFLKPFYDTAKIVTAKDWWSIPDIDKDLKGLICELLTCNPSTASLERIFSTYWWIHDDHRNRMGNEKTAKLLFCFKVLNETE